MQAHKIYDDTATESFPGLRKVTELAEGRHAHRQPLRKAEVPASTYAQHCTLLQGKHSRIKEFRAERAAFKHTPHQLVCVFVCARAQGGGRRRRERQTG